MQQETEVSKREPEVLLATALVGIQIGLNMVKCRALLDSGSQLNLISRECVKRLGVRTKPCNRSIRGIGRADGMPLSAQVTLNIRAWYNYKFITSSEFMIIDNLAAQLPNQPLFDFELPEQITLADPAFNIPAKIDILFGADIWAKTVGDRIFRHLGGAMIQETAFGFVVLGKLEQNTSCEPFCFQTMEQYEDLRKLEPAIEQFLEMQSLCERRARSPEEELVEQLFVQTHYRTETGRYVTSIPLKPNCKSLGDSRQTALKRFHWLERRLQRNPELQQKYVEFMDEYERLGHMQLATRPPLPDAITYYIPHHCIQKKFRVVYDGSCKSSSGQSLNDIQMVGEKLQHDLADIVTRFRRHRIAFSADIAKMFRQVAINPEQWDCQRIIWRQKPSQPLQDFWLTVVTYGLSSSVHNSVRAMIQCGTDHEIEFPYAARVVKNDFYIDDCLTGADSVDEALVLSREVEHILRNGGFELCKWSSNCQELIQLMKGTSASIVELNEDDDTKVLGLRWNTATDELTFQVISSDMPQRPTKRQVMSVIAKLYDPTGFLSPIIVIAKMIMQDMWRLGIGWDAEIPPNVQKQWNAFHSTMSQLQDVRIPRWLGTTGTCTIQLHGFADASCKAYGAVIYARIINNSGIHCQLVTSKSRVAPLATMSIPRLELNAAELLGRLMKHTIEICEFGKLTYHLWTDSTVVLHWLKKSPSDLKVFVANRVSSIQTKTAISAWAHVKSADNPADLLSRGMSMTDFIHSQLWFNGPKWLVQEQANWPKSKLSLAGDSLEQMAAECKLKIDKSFFCFSALCAGKNKSESLLYRFTNWKKIVRVTAFVYRFIWHTRMKVKRERAPNLTLSVAETKRAIAFWIRQTQSEHYTKEIQYLYKVKHLPERSKLIDLHPILDKDGIMRVGGRIGNSNRPYEQNHQAIIPPRSRLGWLLINEAHQETMHGGVQLMMQYLRIAYWIPRMREELRMFVHRCVVCVRMSQETAEQLMGNLPADRIRPAKPFSRTGVDFAGPYTMRARAGRPTRSKDANNTTEKGYVAVFVCLVTRAIHLEVVTGLSSTAFIAALRRFIARRGFCEHIYSDNGTNFVGANKELKAAYESWQSQDTIDFALAKRIQWHFITPSAPFQGGLWEAAVKSMKFHLRRVIGTESYSYEVLHTLLTEVEACLNSRPICAMSDDPDDSEALTPAHFLIGRSLLIPIPEQLSEPPTMHLKLLHSLQAKTQGFWERWSSDYLNTLQQRRKWKSEHQNVRVGQLALIKNENMAPTYWAMGRITKIHTGADNLVRSVRIKIDGREFERPVRKLCILPIDEELEYWQTSEHIQLAE